MKFTTYISALTILLSSTQAFAQTGTKKYVHRILTIEPAIGIRPKMETDLLISAMVQWSPKRRLAFASHSSYSINNMMARDINYVKTDYNHSFNQKVGVGTSFYSKRSAHSFFFMAGVKYTAYQETMNNPDLVKVSTAISSVSPDYGLMYSVKRGGKNCYFTFRTYLPLYPWFMKGSNIQYVDGNLNNIALELGVGVKIK